MRSYSATYIYGHPNIPRTRLRCSIKLEDAEVIIQRIRFGSRDILFTLPYEKIESVDVETEEVLKITRAAASYITLGSLGALLFGKKKQKYLILTVNAIDKKGKQIPIKIVFSDVINHTRIKATIDQKIGEARGITI
jgi:hypothetical protein